MGLYAAVVQSGNAQRFVVHATIALMCVIWYASLVWSLKISLRGFYPRNYEEICYEENGF